MDTNTHSTALAQRIADLELIHASGLDIDLGSDALSALRDAVTAPIPEFPAESGSLLLADVELSSSEIAALQRIGVLGLAGAPKSGKDTIALALKSWMNYANLEVEEYFGHRASKVAKIARPPALPAAIRAPDRTALPKPVSLRAQVRAFSDPIIAEANAFLAAAGTSREITPENKSWPPYRKLLQTYGLERRRADPSYWSKKLREEVNSLVAIGDVVILTGVRTPDDLTFVRSFAEPGLAPQVWKVYRPGNTYRAEHDIEKALDHVSDAEYDHVIVNTENDFAGLTAAIRRGLK